MGEPAVPLQDDLNELATASLAQDLVNSAYSIPSQIPKKPQLRVLPRNVGVRTPFLPYLIHKISTDAGMIFTPAIVSLLILQVFDGVLTGIGVSQFGITAEGNPLIRNLMHVLGLVPTLLLCKIASCVIIIILAVQALKMLWIRSLLKIVVGVYLVCAILPWTFILFNS